MNKRLKNMVDDLINEYKDEELHKISILQSDRKTMQKEHCQSPHG